MDLLWYCRILLVCKMLWPGGWIKLCFNVKFRRAEMREVIIHF